MTGTSRIPCAPSARPEHDTGGARPTGDDRPPLQAAPASEAHASSPQRGPAPDGAQKDASKQQTPAASVDSDEALAQARAAKAALRRHLKAERASLGGPGKQAHDDRIGAQVLAWWRANRPLLLAVYWPLDGEPDLHETYALLAREGALLALPVVEQRHAPLAFAAWTPGETMQADSMGIAIPADVRTVARPPALLVPCLGFDERGYRLGYGGGFYDRTLAPAPRPFTLGIAYACQQVRFDIGRHDVPLDAVVTELTRLD